MWRNSQFLISRSNPLSLFLLLLAAILLFAAAPAHAQETTPPAPPPDLQSAATAPDAQTQSQVRAVRLSDVEGKVQIFEGDQVVFDQAEPNMPAVEGMRLVTGDNGRLEIEFEDGGVARVTPDSSILLAQLRRNADGSTVTQIDALSGLTYYELNNRGGQYTVHFGADTANPIQNAVFRVALDTAPSQLAVMHGAVHIDDGQGLSLDVHPSQTYQTDPQQPGEFTVAQAITADSWDQWNSDRDQALAQLESSQTTARASSGNPDNPAWNDLDYYGNWYNLPGYGQVWSPSGTGPGWDPFGNGAWGYYGNIGYTWISGYPWGWWPYHCGAWEYIDGWGWIWVPGNCGFGFYGAGWYPYATVWRVPKGYIPPPRPHGSPIHKPPAPSPVAGRPVNLVAVDRGSQFSAPFHYQNGVRPDPRPLTFEGRIIPPLDADIHPLQRGPLGEGFTAALVRTHPEMAPSAPRSPADAAFRSAYTPAITGARNYGAPSSFSSYRYMGAATSSHGSFSSGGGASHGSFSSGGGASSGGASHAGGGSVSSGGGGTASGAAASSASHH